MLRDMRRKLTFVPAGYAYRESHHPRVPSNALYFYIDPNIPELIPGGDAPEVIPGPRLFFEDDALWGTAIKLKRVLEQPSAQNRLYAEALGFVLGHELLRMSRGARNKAMVRGGLASWQQRVVTNYIEEHLAEPISLAALASMVRLSQFYFCRAFKQSVGVPPHRYHMTRRIERAKVLLAEHKYSVTEIGVSLGFSAPSSFTAAFRRVTGSTPSGFGRSLI
jgi:AraC family transcriptional regulator